MAYSVNTSGNSLNLGNVWAGSSTSLYSIGTSTGTYTTVNPMTQSASVMINDDGINMKSHTDIVIGGKSIKNMLEAIESRLAILEPNQELEKEWEDLKRLGDEYRALEAEIQEKMKTWDILKK